MWPNIYAPEDITQQLLENNLLLGFAMLEKIVPIKDKPITTPSVIKSIRAIGSPAITPTPNIIPNVNNTPKITLIIIIPSSYNLN